MNVVDELRRFCASAWQAENLSKTLPRPEFPVTWNYTRVSHPGGAGLRDDPPQCLTAPRRFRMRFNGKGHESLFY